MILSAVPHLYYLFVMPLALGIKWHINNPAQQVLAKGHTHLAHCQLSQDLSSGLSGIRAHKLTTHSGRQQC